MTDLSTIEARKQLAKKYAIKYSINLSLICALIEHESSWNVFAVRYEPLFYQRYVVPLKGITATEAQMRATSWGLMQLMGQTAREFGFIGKYLAELCDPEIGIDFGCKKLRHCLDRNVSDESRALLEYNGGKDASYPVIVQSLKMKYE